MYAISVCGLCLATIGLDRPVSQQESHPRLRPQSNRSVVGGRHQVPHRPWMKIEDGRHPQPPPNQFKTSTSRPPLVAQCPCNSKTKPTRKQGKKLTLADWSWNQEQGETWNDSETTAEACAPQGKEETCLA